MVKGGCPERHQDMERHLQAVWFNPCHRLFPPGADTSQWLPSSSFAGCNRCIKWWVSKIGDAEVGITEGLQLPEALQTDKDLF